MATLDSRAALTTPAQDDLMHVVDISDLTGGATGTSKKMALSDLATILHPAKCVLINSLDDFPTPVASVITLEDDKIYCLGNDVNLGSNRIVMGTNTVIYGKSTNGPTLTYDGVGDMFTGVDVNPIFWNVRLNSPNANQTFNFSNVSAPGSGVVQILNMVLLNSPKFGTFSNLLAVTISMIRCPNLDDGISLVGPYYASFDMQQFALVSTSPTFVGVDLGTSLHTNFRLSGLMLGPSGSIGLSGLANSGNINPGNVAEVATCVFRSNITPLSGITSDDIRFAFDKNNGIADTAPDAMVSMQGNIIATPITATGTHVKVAGTWVVERESHFDSDTTGRITYIGERTLTAPIDVVLSAAVVTGTNKNIHFHIAHTGTVILNSGARVLSDAGDYKSTPLVWQLTLVQGDYLEIFVANETDTTDVIVSDAVFRVR